MVKQISSYPPLIDPSFLLLPFKEKYESYFSYNLHSIFISLITFSIQGTKRTLPSCFLFKSLQDLLNRASISYHILFKLFFPRSVTYLPNLESPTLISSKSKIPVLLLTYPFSVSVAISFSSISPISQQVFSSELISPWWIQ